MGMQMKLRMGRWLLGLVMLFVFAGVYTPVSAKAEVVVSVRAGHRYHRRYYRSHYHRHYYHREYHRDYR
jgi:Na+/proline symporter